MLFGILVVNFASDELCDYFEHAVHELDEACGTHITLLSVGDPEKCGDNHRSLRDSDLQRSDARDAIRYVEDIYRTGRERHHRLTEMKKAERRFALSSADVPCVAFLSRTGKRPVGVLRIPRHWYESKACLIIFDEMLRAWLGGAGTVTLATAQLGDVEISARLEPMLTDLASEIDGAIEATVHLDAASGRGCPRTSRAKKPIEVFNTPLGSTWGHVKIRFVDGETAYVAVRKESRVVHFAQMGMIDNRNGTPDKQWELLRELAPLGGEVSWKDGLADGRIQKRIERLAQNLQDYFSIEGKPFALSEDRKGWKARFVLVPPPT